MTGLIPSISSSAPETSSLSQGFPHGFRSRPTPNSSSHTFLGSNLLPFFGGERNTQKRSCRNSSVSNKCKSCVVCQPALKSKNEIVPINKKKRAHGHDFSFSPPKSVSMTLTCISIGRMFCYCLVSSGLFRGSCFPGN